MMLNVAIFHDADAEQQICIPCCMLFALMDLWVVHAPFVWQNVNVEFLLADLQRAKPQLDMQGNNRT
jgi:hypothetical protein